MCVHCDETRSSNVSLAGLTAVQVGVMWHVECGDGMLFPFSRGCSFITLSQDGRKIQTVSSQLISSVYGVVVLLLQQQG